MLKEVGFDNFLKIINDIAPISLHTISGKDTNDSTSIKNDFGDFNKYINNSVKNLKIGVKREFHNNDDSEI